MTANKPERLTAERIAEMRIIHDGCDETCQSSALLAHVAALEADAAKMAPLSIRTGNAGIIHCNGCGEWHEQSVGLYHLADCVVARHTPGAKYIPVDKEHTDNGKENHAV